MKGNSDSTIVITFEINTIIPGQQGLRIIDDSKGFRRNILNAIEAEFLLYFYLFDRDSISLFEFVNQVKPPYGGPRRNRANCLAIEACG